MHLSLAMGESVRELLSDLKDLCEHIVDLAYSAVIFDSRDMAEEVRRLEEEADDIAHKLKIKAMLAARSIEDAEQLSNLLRIAEASYIIANAAADIVDLLEFGIEERGFLSFLLTEGDEKIKAVVINENSDLVGRKVKDLNVESESGVMIITLKRGRHWIHDMEELDEVTLKPGDVLIIRGTEDACDYFEKVAEGVESW